jgi:serine/threonine-protein kinase
MITDLTGCFAADGVVHPDIVGTMEALPELIPDGLFAAPIAQRVSPQDETMDSSIIEQQDDGMLPRMEEVLDKYRIEQELGRGGFAAVYRATHLLMRTSVAIKLLFPNMLRKHPQLAEGLCEEAQLTSLIDHPNVVRVLDVTSSTRFTYIVMEYIDGVSLGRAISRKPLSPANVLKIGIQLCGGLRAAGDQGLIHRDIKPGNILIARTGIAKLVDFGLARRASDLRNTENGRDPKNIAGTPAYIAPEQVTSPETADHRADIYALGATLYHAVVGETPFSYDTPTRMIMAHIHEPPRPPIDVLPDMPAGLSRLLMRMLAKRPEDRPQTYDELSAEFLRVLHGLRPNTTTFVSGTSQGEPSSRPDLLGKLKGLFTPRS